MNLLEKFQAGQDKMGSFMDNTKNIASTMGPFQKKTLMVASAILIILLAIVGIMLQQKNNETFPPSTSSCPDYWVNSNYFKDDDNAYNNAAVSGLESIVDSIPSDENHCVNLHDIGLSSCPKNKNFETDEFQSIEGDCKKKEWAKSCNLTWDGITNNSNLKDC